MVKSHAAGKEVCHRFNAGRCHRTSVTGCGGAHPADPANTCPRTPPVATCMHELQQAMQDSLGCCQRRLYPCPLDTRRFPRRTARAVRAARYGDQPRFQAAVPSMAYIRGGRAAQVVYNYGSSISSSSSSSSSASAARHSKRYRRDSVGVPSPCTVCHQRSIALWRMCQVSDLPADWRHRTYMSLSG